MSLISSSPTQVRAYAAAIDACLHSHLFVLPPADSGQLQIKEVLPIPYTVYMNVDRNQARIFLFGIGAKDTVVVETSGYSELIIGVLKKQHDSSRKEKQERGWVLDSMSDPTGVVDLHVKSAAVTEAGSSDEYMPYDWNKVKLKCKVRLSRPLDPWQVSTTRRHLRRHWPLSQRGEHAIPSDRLRLCSATDTLFHVRLYRYTTEEFMHASYLLYAYTFPDRKIWSRPQRP